MGLPEAVQMYLERLPGVFTTKYIARLPNAQQISPGARCQIQIPRCDAWSTRSAQLVMDVSTSTSTGYEYLLPRHGAQMLIENSTVMIGDRTVGSQSNNLFNVWQYIQNDYTAGPTDQPQMSVYGGSSDVPPYSSTSGGPSFDPNGTYTPANVSTFAGNYNFAGSSVINACTAGQYNTLAYDTTTGKTYYKNGQPCLIEVFGTFCETCAPEFLPTNMFQNAYVDLLFTGTHVLVQGAPTSGGNAPNYLGQNIAMQSTCYTLGEAFKRLNQQMLDSGEIFEIPFKSVQSIMGPLQSGLDIQVNFSAVSQSVDLLVACFLDAKWRAGNAGAQPGTNTATAFTLGKGTGVKSMNYVINGQTTPGYQVTPRMAWGHTSHDLNLSGMGHGVYKNLNSFDAYLRKWFVWAYSLGMPWAEAPFRAITGMNTLGQNAQMSLSVTSDPNGPQGTAESFANIPVIFVVSTQTLLVGAGGAINVQV